MNKFLLSTAAMCLVVLGLVFGKVYKDSHAYCEAPSQNIASFNQDVKAKGFTIDLIVQGQTLANFNAIIKLHNPDDDIPDMDMLEVVYVGDIAFVKAFNHGCTITQMVAQKDAFLAAMDQATAK